MTNWVRAANPFWLMTDLTGGILDDSYYMFVLQNDLPYQPATIYQDPAMSVAWSNPIQFDADGTLPNNMYWDDEVVYRLEIRAGATQSDPLARPVVENFRPSDVSGGTDGDTSINADNQITNPQFAFVWFNSSITGTSVTNPTISLGEGWDLVLTGTGTYILTQDLLNPTDDEPNNSSYALNMNLSGFSAAVLKQRFSNMGMLWGGKFLATQLTAKQASGTTSTIAANLVPSTGSTVPLFSESMTSAYNVFSGTVEVPVSTNTDFPPDGYVELQIVLPPVGDTTVTSVQVVPTDANIDLTYSQDTYERQEDHTWHNYKEQVVVYAKDSILTGWQFGTNPWQFRSPTVAASGAGAVGAAFAAYTADQTIIVEENTTMLNVGRAAGTNHNSTYTITPAGGTQGKFALVQFVDAETTRPYWAYLMSALVRARLSTSLGTAIKFKVDLIYSDTAPSAINPIASWGSTGADIVYTGQWTRVPCNLDNTYTFLNENGVGGSIAGLPTYSFDRYALPLSTSGARHLGIVLHTIDGTLGAGDSLAIEDISLVPNDFGMVANPKTFDQTLQECEYYYEKSYAMSVLPGTATANDSLLAPMVKDFVTNTMYIHAKAFGFPYKNVKRVTPTLTLYSVAGTSANVSGYLYSGAGNATSTAADIAATSWSPTTTTRTTNFDPNSAAILATYGTFATNKADNVWIQYHYVADSRL